MIAEIIAIYTITNDLLNKDKLIMGHGYGFTYFDNFRARLLASFSN